MTASPRPGQSVQRLAVLLAASLGSSPLLAQAPADTARAAAVPESMSVGYGQRRTDEAVGAVTELTAPRLGRGRIVSPEQLLQGTVAGVRVVDNDEPGGELAVRVRGAVSVFGGGDPLYVIDGMPVSVGAGAELSAGRDPLNVLNPADIESITVLRDAGAAAIYGGNATNGVVLITTRSGRGEPQIEYGASMSSSSVSRFPPVLGAAEFRAAVQQYAPQRLGQLGSASTDWFGAVSRGAFGQAHDIALSSAWPHGSLRMSLGYLDQAGLIGGTAAQRLTLGLAFDQRLFTDHLDLRADVRGARLHNQLTPDGVIGNAAAMAPTQPVRDSTAATGYWNWPGTGFSADNPVEIQKLAVADATAWRALGNIQAAYRLPFLDALSAHVNLGYDVTKDSQASFYPSDLHGQVQGSQGYEYLATPRQSSGVLEAWLRYAAALGFAPGRVDATAGYSSWELDTRYPAVTLTGLSTNLLGTSGLPPAATVANSLFLEEHHTVSYFGRVEYDLAERYAAAVTLRHDHSSAFAPDRRDGTFPSVALAWRLSREPFLASVIPQWDLTLRGSWGKTGNQPLGGLPTSLSAQPVMVDPELGWETMTAWDAGLDFGLIGRRIRGSVDWYTRRTDKLFMVVPVAAGINFSNLLLTNIGSMRNRGVELSLSARVLRGDSGRPGWTAAFTVAHNANELLSINGANGITQILVGAVGGGTGNTIQVLQPGYAVNSFLVCQQAYANGRPVQNTYLLPNGTTATGCTGADWRPYKSPWP